MPPPMTTTSASPGIFSGGSNGRSQVEATVLELLIVWLFCSQLRES
jgi:hypothetical protein